MSEWLVVAALVIVVVAFCVWVAVTPPRRKHSPPGEDE